MFVLPNTVNNNADDYNQGSGEQYWPYFQNPMCRDIDEKSTEGQHKSEL